MIPIVLHGFVSFMSLFLQTVVKAFLDLNLAPKPKTLQAMFLFLHSPKCLKASFRNWEVMDWLACARPSFWGGLYSKTQNIASHVFVFSFPQMLESKLSQLGSYGLARMRSPILWGALLQNPKHCKPCFCFFIPPCA
jgi:hypothetical protein